MDFDAEMHDFDTKENQVAEVVLQDGLDEEQKQGESVDTPMAGEEREPAQNGTDNHIQNIQN